MKSLRSNTSSKSLMFSMSSRRSLKYSMSSKSQRCSISNKSQKLSSSNNNLKSNSYLKQKTSLRKKNLRQVSLCSTQTQTSLLILMLTSG